MTDKPKRGRPPLHPELVKSLRSLGDDFRALLDASAGLNHDILGNTAQLRADGLAKGRYVKAALKSAEPVKPESARVKRLAALLGRPSKAHWCDKSSSNIAALLAAQFPEVKPGTLRKDVSAARKLASLTR